MARKRYSAEEIAGKLSSYRGIGGQPTLRRPPPYPVVRKYILLGVP